MNLYNVPSYALPILFEKFNFKDFAHTFNVWRHGKDLQTQQHVLGETDIIHFFVAAGWEPQFLPFIHYAAHVQVLDAIFYTLCYMLFHERQHTEDAVLMLKQFGEEGHLLSKFTYSIFCVFHIPAMKAEGMQNLLQMVKNPGMYVNLSKWVSYLQAMKKSWNPFQFEYNMVGEVCNKSNHNSNNNHFNEKGWPIFIEDLGKLVV